METQYPDRRKRYTARPAYLFQAKHLSDVFLNLGYDYRGKMLKKGTSPELWANPLQVPLISVLEGMLNFMLEHTKYVKKWFSIAHDKNTMNIN